MTVPRDGTFIGILWARANEATLLASETNQPDQWASRILASAGPLLAAAARPTVTIDAPMDSDVEALQEGLERIRELAGEVGVVPGEGGVEMDILRTTRRWPGKDRAQSSTAR